MKIRPTLLFPVLLGGMNGACRHTETSATAQAAPAQAISVDPQILVTSKVNWSARSDYVAMNIPFEPVAAVKQQIEDREHVTLKSRGEAHITILSPQELTVLRSKLSLEQINGLVEKSAVQKTPVKLECLGTGHLKQGPKVLTTYYLVVTAPGLGVIREKLSQIFVAAGGEKPAFAAELFYPHITVGYTDRDLHYADGVVKDKASCLFSVN